VDGDLQLVPGAEKYLAPELADASGRWGAGRPGPGLDLYGAAFCALEMLAGPKFDGLFPGMTAGGADTAALWWKWHASAADPRDLVDSLVPAPAGRLREALRSMLAKPVAERAASARAVLDALGTAAIPVEIRVDAAPVVAAAAAGAAASEVEPRAARVSAIRHEAAGSPSATSARSESPAPAAGRPRWLLPAALAALAMLLAAIGMVAWSRLAGRASDKTAVAGTQKVGDRQKTPPGTVVAQTPPVTTDQPAATGTSSGTAPAATTTGTAVALPPVSREPSAGDLSEGILQ
jgi:hypothetical protein